MKVYILTQDGGDAFEFVGVFSTKEKANDYILLQSPSCDEYEIEEHEIDVVTKPYYGW
jgi:hypothetical protein